MPRGRKQNQPDVKKKNDLQFSHDVTALSPSTEPNMAKRQHSVFNKACHWVLGAKSTR